MFIAPEIKSIVNNKENNVLNFNPLSSDTYSLACILVYMITLGECEKELRSEQISVKEYVIKHSLLFTNEFPIVSKFIS